MVDLMQAKIDKMRHELQEMEQQRRYVADFREAVKNARTFREWLVLWAERCGSHIPSGDQRDFISLHEVLKSYDKFEGERAD
jgi:hypothetical protein